VAEVLGAAVVGTVARGADVGSVVGSWTATR